MKTEIKRLDSRLQQLGNSGCELPNWMRGMECLFGKYVCFNLLALAITELQEPATAEQVNKTALEQAPKDDSWDYWTLHEAIQDREWFMEHGQVTDALTRLCGLKGEITVESLENRMREVAAAIQEQDARMDGEIAAREVKS